MMEQLQNLKFTGMGNAAGGHYNEVTISGIATFSEEVVANKISVSGICTVQAPMTAEFFRASGIVNADASIRGGGMDIGGNFTAKDKLEGDSISCTGILTACASVSADAIDVGGILTAKEVFGDVVTIRPRSFSHKDSRSKVDHIECTELTAAHCDFGEIWAQNVTLYAGCTVEKLYCDGEINVSDDCKVGKVYRMGEEAELPAPTIEPISEEEAEDLDEQLEELDDQIEEIEGEIEDLDGEMEDLDDDLEEIQDELSDIHDLIADNSDEIEELRDGNDPAALRNAEVRGRDLACMRKEIMERYEQAQTNVAAQRAKLEVRREELEQKQQKLQEKRAQMEQGRYRKSDTPPTITVEMNGQKTTVDAGESLGDSVRSVVKASMDMARNAINSVRINIGSSDRKTSNDPNLDFVGKTVSSLPWEDDGKLRLVAFVGHKLVQEGDRGCRELTFTYEGNALDVICTGSLKCHDIVGNASAGDSMECGNVGGNVTAGDGVDCGEVHGNVSAGDGVDCANVGGDVSAGDSVDCNEVGGSVKAGDGVECGNVGGNVTAGDGVECGNVGGNVRAGDGVECGDVYGSVTADGDVECGCVKGDVHAGGDLHCSKN